MYKQLEKLITEYHTTYKSKTGFIKHIDDNRQNSLQRLILSEVRM